MESAIARVVCRDRPGARALWYEITDGPYVGSLFAVPSDEFARLGTLVHVRFCPADQFAYQVAG